MVKFLLRMFVIILVGTFTTTTALACDSNQIDVTGDGTNCQSIHFSIGTTTIVVNGVFSFYMSAVGTFYVDWGDGTVDTITRTDTTETLYDHTYTSAGTRTIRFGGLATDYNTNETTAAVRFYGGTPGFIASVSGNMSAMFPYISGNGANGAQPRFYSTFSAATNLTNISGTLFNDYTKASSNMFVRTFMYCSNLAEIPETLFGNITVGASELFWRTFQYCGRLTSIPVGLFHSFTRFGGAMFDMTFANTGITEIPENLFSNITTGTYGMFWGTFAECDGLTHIPENLFAGVTSGASEMFHRTFANCRNITGYIPPSTFAGLIANGSPNATNMWFGTFENTQLATSCPMGTTQYITGYEGSDATDSWNGKVSCTPNTYNCAVGYYLPANTDGCTICPENSHCAGGTYTFNATTGQGITACLAGLYAPAGMWAANQCGHILHIGDEVVYLHGVKKTSPSLHVKIGNDIFYGNMTTSDVVMHAGTAHKLKVQYDNTTYSIYDDTVNVNP